MADFSNNKYVENTTKSKALIQQQQMASMGSSDPEAIRKMIEASQYQTHEQMEVAKKGRNLTEEEKKAVKTKAKSEAKEMEKEVARQATEGTINYPTIDKQKYEEWNDQTAPIDTGMLEEYGNNFFELYTYDAGLQQNDPNRLILLAGVLKEVPSFGMGSQWDKGPGQSLSDTVKGYMCSPVMEMITTVGGHDRSWSNLDEGTDRTYKATTKPSFSLNFRIYTTEVIGTTRLTTWQTWLKALTLYTMPSIASKVNINAMGNNALNGVVMAFDKAMGALKTTKEAFSDARNKDKDMIDSLVTGIKEFVNVGADSIAGRDGPGRVNSTSNIKNYYGAKIWKLRILPGIFENPLIVYISDWGVTYSKELNVSTGEPIWVEFKITCEMDQVASVPIWMHYLSKDASINGVISTRKPKPEKEDEKKDKKKKTKTKTKSSKKKK